MSNYAYEKRNSDRNGWRNRNDISQGIFQVKITSKDSGIWEMWLSQNANLLVKLILLQT